MRVSVSDDAVDAHRHAAGRIGTHQQFGIVRLLRRTEHHHAVAEHQFRMRDRAVGAVMDRLLGKAERAREEGDRGRARRDIAAPG